jgi:hypothetical protein
MFMQTLLNTKPRHFCYLRKVHSRYVIKIQSNACRLFLYLYEVAEKLSLTNTPSKIVNKQI